MSDSTHYLDKVFVNKYHFLKMILDCKKLIIIKLRSIPDLLCARWQHN